MRKQPPGPPPEVTPLKNENIITQVREYQLITPLFGGGVTPGEYDPVTVIRGTEIRGQLRFWWRATRSGQFTKLSEMKKAEDRLWGAPYTKGQQGISQEEIVQIAVEVTEQGQGSPQYPFTVDNNGKLRFHKDKAPPYAAFPLQTSRGPVQGDVRFTLRISFPKDKRTDIEAALWAWETLGGIGGRTRRGFGALQCVGIKENDQNVPVDLPRATREDMSRWLQKNLERHVAAGSWPADVPHLSNQMIEGKHFVLVRRNNSQDASSTWEYLIESLKNFRQMRRQSTMRDARHPGRSMWPEPSAIRHITGPGDPRHANPIPNPAVDKFPRAAFGLPIIFHFKGGELGDTTLEGTSQEFERLASPLILRPIGCKNNEFIGIAFVLEGPRIPPGGIQLTKKNGSPHPVNTTLTRAEASRITPLDSEPDVLQAFLNYIGG